MVKKLYAFTLIEVLMAVGIISVISVFAANNVRNTNADELKLRFQKCNRLIHKIAADMADDTYNYPLIPVVNTTTGQPIHDSKTGKTIYRGFLNNYNVGGSSTDAQKFNKLFGSYIQRRTAYEPTSGTTWNFKAKDGSYWALNCNLFGTASPDLVNNTYYASVTVDVNGTENSPNCPLTGESLTSASSCSENSPRDTFCYKIYHDGAVEITSTCGNKNQTNYIKNNHYLESTREKDAS